MKKTLQRKVLEIAWKYIQPALNETQPADYQGLYYFRMAQISFASLWNQSINQFANAQSMEDCCY
jgi:hypothetical protein